MQDKKSFWMNDHVPQILNDDFNAFFLFDFCHWSLILVLTADAGHASIFTTTPESHHSQLLESMIIFTSTMLCRQQALTLESASLTGLSFDSNQSQRSLQIPPFCNKIKNQSQSRVGDTKNWENYKRHLWKESGCGNHEQGHEGFNSNNTVNNELVKSQVGVVSPALTETQQCAET